MAFGSKMYSRDVPIQEILSSMPSWEWVVRLRGRWISRHLAAAGTDIRLARGVIVRYPERVSFGSQVFLNRNTLVTARAPISFGDKVLVGPGVIIDSGGHRFDDVNLPVWDQGFESSPIVIGDDVWIGAGAIILPGVEIGSSSIVAAGSVVTSSLGSGVLAAGVPAQIVRRR